jgi:hypothetical protein
MIGGKRITRLEDQINFLIAENSKLNKDILALTKVLRMVARSLMVDKVFMDNLKRQNVSQKDLRIFGELASPSIDYTQLIKNFEVMSE